MVRKLFNLLAACLLLCASRGEAAPNVVLILVDDLGRQDMTCEGSPFYETPNIDRLAAQAMRFTNGYAACQVCSPSRAAIQTGKYPARVRITDYIGAPQPPQWKRNTRLLPAPYQLQLGLEETTLAEALVDKGYKTFFAGKWHLGGEGFLPTDQGYAINQGGHAAGSPPGGFFSPYKNPKLTDGPPGELLPLRLASETAQFIRESSQTGKPFFAMLSFYSVHAPIQTTQELWKKYRNKADALGLIQDRQRFLLDRTQEVRQVQDNPLYAGMMESMDQGVGIVLDALTEAGVDDNTIVIFTSDNGGVSSGDGYATSCLPFRGGKGRQWEGGLRTPLYIRWPGVTNGTASSELASHIDLFPTILDMVGASPSSYGQVDGISLAPAMRGQRLSDRALFWHYPHYGNQGGEPSAVVRHGEWKLIHYFEDGHDELYHVAADIGEQTDLAATMTERVQDLKQRLEQWQREVGAVSPTPNPNYDDAKHAADMARMLQTTIPNREREHARYLAPDFVPNGGWWQDNARRK